jgi:hypothetical protein
VIAAMAALRGSQQHHGPTADGVRLEVVVRLRDLLERSVSRITLTPASSTAPSTPPGISSRTAGATSPVSMRT